MPTFEQQDDGSFQAVMLQGDAEETRIAEAIEVILRMATTISGRPHDAAARNKDRGGYYRYSEVERSVQIISREANDALKHIAFLDFPECVKHEGSA